MISTEILSYIGFIVLGFLSGSVLYSRLLPLKLCSVDISLLAEDKNPGSGNVFQICGPALGIPCLTCDIIKGAVPVALCLQILNPDHPLFGLVLAAPVFGHAKKGKAIAVSFGVLIGLLPLYPMVWYLVIPFLFFSAGIRVTPHSWRVILSFLGFLAACLYLCPISSLRLGGILISALVIGKHLAFSKSRQERLRCVIGWDLSLLRHRDS